MMRDGNRKNLHMPVLIDVIGKYIPLDLEEKNESDIVVVDACFGEGGYTDYFLSLDPRITVVGIEQDAELFGTVSAKYSGNDRVRIFNDNFRNLDAVLEKAGYPIGKPVATAVVFDLGLSMFHLKKSEKGLTFFGEQPLDMRLSPYAEESAADLVNLKKEEELADIFYYFGDETYGRAIAKAIIIERHKKKLKTTAELHDLVCRVKPRQGRQDPATKVFQALRIAVNREFENLEIGLEKALALTIHKGRILVVSYHSGEDRIVKHFFKEHEDTFSLPVKKPIVPEFAEIRNNPSARSAKLRIAEINPEGRRKYRTNKYRSDSAEESS